MVEEGWGYDMALTGVVGEGLSREVTFELILQ